MLLKEDLQWLVFEGYLSKLCELDMKHTTDEITPEAKTKYKLIQIFVMYLIAHELVKSGKVTPEDVQNPKNVHFGNASALTPELWMSIANKYPMAIRKVVGDAPADLNKLNDIHIPIINPSRDKDRIPEIWESIPDEEKSKIYAIQFNVKQLMGV